jgi:hypothetical protein
MEGRNNMQQQSKERFIVRSDALISYIEDVCESAAKIQLIKTRKSRINKNSFTSHIVKVEIDANKSLTLIINSDDSLIDAVFEINSLHLIEDLTNTVAIGIVDFLHADMRFGYSILAAPASNGIIAQTYLMHASGCIEVYLTELDKYPASITDF